MIKTITFQSALVASSILMVTACGPENNSRYGDEFWDPNDTLERFDPIEAPDITVTYYDAFNSNDDSDPANARDISTRVSIDFDEVNRRSKNGVVLSYQKGFASDKLIDDLINQIQGGVSSFTDTQFINDTENAEDRRLEASVPGEYSLILDFDVVMPNGNTVSYVFDDMDFVVPGCVTNYEYYDDYVNPVLASSCVSCHDSGVPSNALDLPADDLTARRTSFIGQLVSALDGTENSGAYGAAGGTVNEWIADAQHPGSSNLAALPAEELAAFNTYLNVIETINTDTGHPENTNETTDFSFVDTDGSGFCFDRPADFEIENPL